MDLHETPFSSILPLAAAVIFLSHAIQRPAHERVRLALGILHALSVLVYLIATSRQSSLSSFSQFAVPLIIGLAIHSTAILFVQKSVVRHRRASYLQRIRTVYRIWTNVRNLPLDRYKVSLPEEPDSKRMWFAAKRVARLVALWCLQRGATSTISFIFRRLNVTTDSLSPSHQGLVPLASDTAVRGIMSVYWIWTSYYSLTLGHDLAAILFVAILGWDSTGEWPPLFGNLMDAYTLRRFWGDFWHGLHVHPFTLWIPFPHFSRSRRVRGAFTSFWVFVLAALSHAAVNLVLYRKPFLIYINSEKHGSVEETLR
ncbi:hypothetical protein PG996_007682 [Apiospora saccharicola]|uniref:Wax synthase domain-containing protein n=1 Tax=Apiospora saccharicola TaxID=335842 RepID=A0ABR1VEC2_9PEZI